MRSLWIIRILTEATIDRWIEEGWEWGRPVTHEVFTAAVSGDWDVKLTPTKMVPHSWFGDLKGKRVLGLASGGGMRCTFRRISPCAQ